MTFKQGLAVAVLAMLCCSDGVAAPDKAGSALSGDDNHQAWIRFHDAQIQAELDAAAARLEIKASQQSPWTEYSQAFKAVREPPSGANSPDDIKDDAAARIRRHANEISALAQKLSRLADATSKLQAVLTPDQRETLNQISRSAEREFGPAGRPPQHPLHGGEGFADRGSGQPDEGHAQFEPFGPPPGRLPPGGPAE